jgi:predicted dehydrogenase
MVSILIIGCGYHAKRIYIPYFSRLHHARVGAIVDVRSHSSSINQYLDQQKLETIERCYTECEEPSDVLSPSEVEVLNALVKRCLINAVVIATEPLAHFKYAKWALSSNLHILMDKPITTEICVSTDVTKAKKLYSDYVELKLLYMSMLRERNLVFSLQAQRRLHEGFLICKALVAEIADRTNCPITSINASHSDGQWRFPREIVTQKYHSYNQGYGKMSHSGYHSLDASIWLAQSALRDSSKTYDTFDVYATAVRPIDFLSQITTADYQHLFPAIPAEYLLSSEDLQKLVETEGLPVTGEIDAHSLVTLRRGARIITHIGIDAAHNGFSQRNWISAEGRDLYKGNGRVRHESYTIRQGPFQTIIINSFQSHELLRAGFSHAEVGGEYHFDIYVFRNSTLFPDYAAYSKETIRTASDIDTPDFSRGHQENARRTCIVDFLSSIARDTPPCAQSTNFLSHELSTQVLSGIYQSLARDSDRKVIVGKVGIPYD